MGKARIPAEERSKQLQRYYDNREALLEYQRAYRKANADAIKERQNLYRQKHREKLRAYSREWARRKRAASRVGAPEAAGEKRYKVYTAIIAEKEGNVK